MPSFISAVVQASSKPSDTLATLDVFEVKLGRGQRARRGAHRLARRFYRWLTVTIEGILPKYVIATLKVHGLVTFSKLESRSYKIKEL